MELLCCTAYLHFFAYSSSFSALFIKSSSWAWLLLIAAYNRCIMITKKILKISGNLLINLNSAISAYLHFLLSALVKIDLLIVWSHLPVNLLCLLAEASTLLVSQLLHFSVSLKLNQKQISCIWVLQHLNWQCNHAQLKFRANLDTSVAKLLNTLWLQLTPKMESNHWHKTRKYALIWGFEMCLTLSVQFYFRNVCAKDNTRSSSPSLTRMD